MTQIKITVLRAEDSGAAWPLPASGAIPPRNHLYRLVPCGRGTPFSESLTSYLNRLAWRHHVAPQQLVAQDIAPRLRQPYWRALKSRG